MKMLTVIMGSNGPKISSVMIPELAGGSNSNVGSMKLKTRNQINIIILHEHRYDGKQKDNMLITDYLHPVNRHE